MGFFPVCHRGKNGRRGKWIRWRTARIRNYILDEGTVAGWGVCHGQRSEEITKKENISQSYESRSETFIWLWPGRASSKDQVNGWMKVCIITDTERRSYFPSKKTFARQRSYALQCTCARCIVIKVDTISGQVVIESSQKIAGLINRSYLEALLNNRARYAVGNAMT